MTGVCKISTLKRNLLYDYTYKCVLILNGMARLLTGKDIRHILAEQNREKKEDCKKRIKFWHDRLLTLKDVNSDPLTSDTARFRNECLIKYYNDIILELKSVTRKRSKYAKRI